MHAVLNESTFASAHSSGLCDHRRLLSRWNEPSHVDTLSDVESVAWATRDEGDC